MGGIGDLFKNPVQSAIEGVLGSAGKIIERFKADPTKVAELDAELERLKASSALESQKLATHLEEISAKERENEDNQVSERWKSDLTSDNTLSKVTRPLVVLSLLAFVYIIIVVDSIGGIKFDVKEDYIGLLSSLLLTTIVAYFGSRGVEKWKSMSEKGKK